MYSNKGSGGQGFAALLIMLAVVAMIISVMWSQ